MSLDATHISVVHPGPRTTVQDLGRRGSQGYGVSVSGALDVDAAVLGNRLVGNDIGAAVLEVTLGGAEFLFSRDANVAVTGAVVEVRVNGATQPMWTTLIVPGGCSLQIGAALIGTHAYVAVSGGMDVPKVLGSRSTHLGTRMGGLDGRALTGGDELRCGILDVDVQTPRGGTSVPQEFDVNYVASSAPIRAVQGSQFASFTEDGLDAFWNTDFRVSSVSDRQASRLEGAVIEAVDGRHDIVSDAVYFGAVQVPSDGQPIVLLADRQSTGGYAKVASVITADLGRFAQLAPSSEVRFERLDVETAQAIGRERFRATRFADLTEPPFVAERTFVCNAQDHRVGARMAGQTSFGDELWWVAINDEDERVIVVEHR